MKQITVTNSSKVWIPPVVEKPEPIDNTELVEAFRVEGGHVYHRPPTAYHRGVTFAYIQRGRRVELATAVQHANDTFTKKIGTKTAIEHFREGRTIFLPLPKDAKALDLLRWIIG